MERLIEVLRAQAALAARPDAANTTFTLLYHVARVLRNLTYVDANKARALVAGGVEVTWAALHAAVNERHFVRESELATKECLILLWHVALPTEARASVLAAGAANDAIASLQRFPQADDIIEGAIMVLRLLAEAFPQQIAETGAIEAVVKAANRHVAHFHVAHVACLFLSDIVIPDSVKPRVGKAGGIEVVVAALQRHHTMSSLAYAGCVALQNATHTSANQARVRKCGGLAALRAALAAHADDPRIVSAASNALSYCQRG